ncbi:hypothetical protein GKA01_26470 [Gluconobacter kanchanaburiensis NBRC 103587]|uniref:Uncharacterized protein n=1 Tax=Gluconobacter kanchanaburiensis NBRC 103587 TaxID=1307948 RepID=A0A511BAK8_9PROT|nr:hypothetical protein AA103587_2432 [Gluconobacter kanchanaburiensis NBRC 103587]GEK97450.1 hypothetical protein GKA01_26470 [Gluconobacter kanchanaburiensis NBRC 103587]
MHGVAYFLNELFASEEILGNEKNSSLLGFILFNDHLSFAKLYDEKKRISQNKIKKNIFGLIKYFVEYIINVK